MAVKKDYVKNKYHFDKHIWEGWKVKDFINELVPTIDIIMTNPTVKSFKNKKDLAKWCAENQPYYKKVIPEVVNYFADKYNIK